MAGQPKSRAMRAELLRRARAAGEDDANDDVASLIYLTTYQADGRTLTQLADEIAKATGFESMRSTLSKWASETQKALGGEFEGALDRARARGAHAMVEREMLEAEAAEADRDTLAKRKLLWDMKFSLAKVWNRAEFGEQRGPNVVLNIGQLHLAALKALPLPPVTDDIADAIVEDVPELSDGEGEG